MLRALIILLMSLLLAGLVNLVHSKRIPWIQNWDSYVESKAQDAGIAVVSWAFAQEQFKAGNAIFIDARPVDEFRAGHIRGAVSLPFEQLDDSFDMMFQLVESDQPLIIYCQNRDCDDGLLLALEFLALEKTNLYYFVDGFDTWREAGCPVVTP